MRSTRNDETLKKCGVDRLIVWLAQQRKFCSSGCGNPTPWLPLAATVNFTQPLGEKCALHFRHKTRLHCTLIFCASRPSVRPSVQSRSSFPEGRKCLIFFDQRVYLRTRPCRRPTTTASFPAACNYRVCLREFFLGSDNEEVKVKPHS